MRAAPLLLSSIALLFATAAQAREPDLRVGKEINEVCSGCHGEFGQGGKGGEYPRLAGLPASYIDKQMHLYRARQRPNMPMNEYVDERQAPDADIEDVSAYLASLTLATRPPPLKEGERVDGLERLKQVKMVLNIPRSEGDVAKGEKRYNLECRSCHGEQGWGRADKGVPQLAGQYTNYLWRQIAFYREGKRTHDESDKQDKFLKGFKDEELRDIFAWLSVVDD